MRFFDWFYSLKNSSAPRRFVPPILVCALVVSLFGCGSSPKDEAPVSANAIALPERVKTADFKTLDGKSIRLQDFAGKVVVLDLWATWCGPCRQEIPHLVELQQQYNAQGLEVIGLDFGNEPANLVNSFAQQLNINYKLAWVSDDLAPTLMAGYDSIPQTYVISRDGKILHRFVGFHPVRTPEKMREIVEAALKQKV
jgi:thiol-disulfide isomerase/thioredoxin